MDNRQLGYQEAAQIMSCLNSKEKILTLQFLSNGPQTLESLFESGLADESYVSSLRRSFSSLEELGIVSVSKTNTRANVWQIKPEFKQNISDILFYANEMDVALQQINLPLKKENYLNCVAEFAQHIDQPKHFQMLREISKRNIQNVNDCVLILKTPLDTAKWMFKDLASVGAIVSAKQKDSPSKVFSVHPTLAKPLESFLDETFKAGRKIARSKQKTTALAH